MKKVTFQGNPLTLEGSTVKVGEKLREFVVIANDLTPVKSSETNGVRIFLSVPSIDTPVCDMEVKNFNKNVSELSNIACYTISADLPFAQSRWCALGDIECVKTFSDYKDREFGKATGTYITELGLLTRASFVVDSEDTVVFAEYLEEITNEPSYDLILEAAKQAK